MLSGSVNLTFCSLKYSNLSSFAGDVEHTHLVKGLDFALLNKIRSEIGKKPDGSEDADDRSRFVDFNLARQLLLA